MMRCKTRRCPEVVEYEPKPVNGVTTRLHQLRGGRARVYLTCDGATRTRMWSIDPGFSNDE